MVKKNYILICLTYFFIYFSNALFIAFFQIFLEFKGFSESKVGILSSITPLLCIIANPLYSIIGKNNKKVRYLLLVLCILEAIVILLVYHVNEFSLLVVVMCLVAMIDPPLFIILDSYTSSFVKEHNKNYSYIRMIGTLSYAIGSLIAGFIIEISGYATIFYSASFLMLISLVLVLLLKTNNKSEERNKGDFKLLLKNKSFLIFAIYFMFILSFQLLGDTYISIYLTKEKELNESLFGIINFSWVIVELIFIIILNEFKIKNEKSLLIIMGMCYLLRFVALGFDASLPLVIFSALIRGISMAIYVCLYIPILNKIIKPSNMPIALLIIGMFKSLLSTIMISTTGFFVENIGYEMIFIFWSVLLFLVIIGYYFFSKEKYCIKN